MLASMTIGIGDAAELLGTTVETLRRWCAKGSVPFWVTPGGQRRFDSVELERWLEHRRL